MELARDAPGGRAGRGRSEFRIGLLAHVGYNRTVVKPQVGDLVVLDSDGVSEATSPVGDELGRDGLMNLVRKLGSSSAEVFGIQLT